MTEPSMLHIGTSSWLHDGWRGVFYPEQCGRAQCLHYYVRQFDSVEANTTSYALPRAATVLDWVETATPGFTFALKAPRTITHGKRLEGVEGETLAFLDVAASMGENVGPVLFQFPPDFTRKAHGRRLAHWLRWLSTARRGLRVAIEVRSPDLMTAAFAAHLADLGLALALVVRDGAPDLYELWASLAAGGRSPGFAYVRWIGDDRHGPKGDNELQHLRDGELETWAGRLRWLSGEGQEVFGFMHNTFEGHAPASARRLLTLLNGPTREARACGSQLTLL